MLRNSKLLLLAILLISSAVNAQTIDPPTCSISGGTITCPNGSLTPGTGSGTVTSVSVTTANGVSGVVANPTTTPAITLTLGNITPSTINGNTITTGTGTLTLGAGKTATISNTLTFTGNDGATLNIGAGGTVGPFTIGTTTITGGVTNGLIYNNAGVVGNLTTTASGVLVTNGASVPSISSTLPSGLAIPGFAPLASPSFTGTVTMPDTTTFGANGASVAAVQWSGTLFTGGTSTTTFPQLIIQPTGTTAVTTWSTSGTGLGMNLASGFVGNFLDFHVAGGGSVFTVASAGSTVAGGSITSTNGSIRIGNNTGQLSIGSVNDALLTRKTAASWQLGAADAASPVAQTLSVQSVVAGTVAANGANWTLIGSLPTGTGTSGDIIIQTGVKTGSGTTQGTATTALTIKGETQALVTAALDASTSTGGALQVAGGASVAKRFWIPAITTSSGLQTAVLCQSSGGEMIADSVACLASSARFKNIRGSLSSDVVDKFMKLPIKIWAYKPEGIFKKGNWTRDRIGPIAEDVEKLDPRLVEYDRDGQVRAYSTEQLLAYTIRVVQEQQIEITALKRRFH